MADAFWVNELEGDVAEVIERITELTDEDLAVIDDAAGDLKSALRREQNRRHAERQNTRKDT